MKVIKTVLDAVSEGFAMNQESVSIEGDENDLQLIKWCIETGYIEERKMYETFHQCICIFGRKMLEKDSCSPQAAQYTLRYDANDTINALLRSPRPAYYNHRHLEEMLDKDDLLYKVMSQMKAGTAFID